MGVREACKDAGCSVFSDIKQGWLRHDTVVEVVKDVAGQHPDDIRSKSAAIDVIDGAIGWLEAV